MKFGSCSYDRHLFAQSLYDEYGYTPTTTSKSLSTITIFFIIVAVVAISGIIITIICYYCRKKEFNNFSFTPKEPPEGVAAPSPYPLMQ